MASSAVVAATISVAPTMPVHDGGVIDYLRHCNRVDGRRRSPHRKKEKGEDSKVSQTPTRHFVILRQGMDLKIKYIYYY